MERLTRRDVQDFLATAVDSFPHGACLACECFLGYVTRIRIDSDETSRDVLDAYRVERKWMHNCLGCDPCPPGDLYSAYVRKKNAPSSDQTLTVL